MVMMHDLCTASGLAVIWVRSSQCNEELISPLKEFSIAAFPGHGAEIISYQIQASIWQRISHVAR